MSVQLTEHADTKLERGHIPLYYQLEKILRDKIAAGEIAPEETFPTEQELCSRYGVSRAVVRQAFGALLQDGLISRIPGKGTFLARQEPSHRTLHCFNTIEELVELSAQAVNVIRYKGLVTPGKAAASLFSLGPGERLYSLRGIRILKNNPVCYFVINLPGEFAGFFDDENLETGAILPIVEKKSGLLVHRVRQTITAGRARKHTAKHVGLEEGDPVLQFERIYFTADDKVLEAGTSYFHPDRYHYVMEFSHKK
ncbi:MAG: GntR family transcriptional regulator [Desulfomonilaceae bacterium]|nr:GntR family transcriptional regulator [Desulfomonilaceae bacterium]